MTESENHKESRCEQLLAERLDDFKKRWPEMENEKGYVDGMPQFGVFEWNVIHDLVYAAFQVGFENGWEDRHRIPTPPNQEAKP
jgi:hypothetical protein